MGAEILNKLLKDCNVDNESREDIKDDYRDPIQDLLESTFSGEKPNIKYGGSLRKGTAIKDDSDIDIICYLDADTNLTLQEIYNRTYDALIIDGYQAFKQNSAIKVMGRDGDEKWDKTIDVVPGKYSDHKTDNAYLWCNKTKTSLKTNPIIQSEKVKNSDYKDVVKLIKLYRHNNNFEFKSFFLEIFTIDIVEKSDTTSKDIMDKLVNFCEKYNQIGITTIHDPANSNNNIMEIHNEFEFQIIREKIHKLYEALLTDNDETIEKCILGKQYDLDEGYKNNATDTSSHINFLPVVRVTTFYLSAVVGDTVIYNGETVQKEKDIWFALRIPDGLDVDYVNWIVVNAGYEARKNEDLRGEEIVKNKEKYEKERVCNGCRVFLRKEHTKYYGNHFVQAKIYLKHSGTEIFSSTFMVKIR